jgi:molecular chaperone GrpE (heat shock protein)
MSETTMEELAQRLDELTREVRRQGRAAVAAQAAAESCLEAITARSEEESDETAPEDGATGNRDSATSDAWLTAIVPVADSLDRIIAQAGAMSDRRREPARARLWPFGKSPVAGDPELGVLLQGLRVLRAQLGSALAGVGVEIDRRIGIAVDPEVHRVVELRAGHGSEERVLEIVRPGYSLDGRVVREAEVAASTPKSRA